jgi:hypothetical protein
MFQHFYTLNLLRLAKEIRIKSDKVAVRFVAVSHTEERAAYIHLCKFQINVVL